MPPKPRKHTDPPLQYEIVEHTADWSLRVYGTNLRQLFINAAIGVSSLLVEDLDSLPDDHERKLMLEAIDAERRHRLSFWDALIIVAAQASGAGTILSEDFNHGQKYGSVEVVNPFL